MNKRGRTPHGLGRIFDPPLHVFLNDTFEGVNLEDADKLFITKVKETHG